MAPVGRVLARGELVCRLFWSGRCRLPRGQGWADLYMYVHVLLTRVLTSALCFAQRSVHSVRTTAVKLPLFRAPPHPFLAAVACPNMYFANLTAAQAIDYPVPSSAIQLAFSVEFYARYNCSTRAVRRFMMSALRVCRPLATQVIVTQAATGTAGLGTTHKYLLGGSGPCFLFPS